jgi:hypothetical protein
VSDWESIGLESNTNLAVTRLNLFGSMVQRVGRNNPALTSLASFGSVVPYHVMETRAGSGDENGPAELADHAHLFLRSIQNTGVTTAGAARANPMPAHRQFFQIIGTFGSPVDADTSAQANSFVAHGGARDIAGTDLPGEISIDTTATNPSGATFAGDVVFRYSANPNVLAGQRFILRVENQTVAGIQAAMYNATVTTPSAETSPGSGIWQFTLSVQGLDASHWTATAGTPGGTQQGLSTLTGNYRVAPAATLAVSQVAVPSVSGDPHLLDVTLTATPSADVVVGHVFSLMLRAATTITGLTTGVWWPGTVVSVAGNVVRVRLGGSRMGLRYRFGLTLGGTTDTNTTDNVAAIGVRDPRHDVVQGEILASMYRNGAGVPQVFGFGSCIFGPSVARSVAVGMDLFVGDNDTFAFGTSQATNRATLVGSRLTASGGFSTGTARWTSGTGSPENVVTAPVGSLYTRTDGGAGTTLYVKESGTGNTGWVAK